MCFTVKAPPAPYAEHVAGADHFSQCRAPCVQKAPGSSGRRNRAGMGSLGTACVPTGARNPAACVTVGSGWTKLRAPRPVNLQLHLTNTCIMVRGVRNVSGKYLRPFLLEETLIFYAVKLKRHDMIWWVSPTLPRPLASLRTPPPRKQPRSTRKGALSLGTGPT